VEKYGGARRATDNKIIWRMRFVPWITKGTDTHSEYVILIAVLQQRLCERAWMLRYTPVLFRIIIIINRNQVSQLVYN
jgi:hypothetical protein